LAKEWSPRACGPAGRSEHRGDDRRPYGAHHAADQAHAETLTIFTQTKNRQAALDNPQEYALQAARIVREKAIQQPVDGPRRTFLE
jgi:hypothetical protein